MYSRNRGLAGMFTGAARGIEPPDCALRVRRSPLSYAGSSELHCSNLSLHCVPAQSWKETFAETRKARGDRVQFARNRRSDRRGCKTGWRMPSPRGAGRTVRAMVRRPEHVQPAAGLGAQSHRRRHAQQHRSCARGRGVRAFIQSAPHASDEARSALPRFMLLSSPTSRTSFSTPCSPAN